MPKLAWKLYIKSETKYIRICDSTCNLCEINSLASLYSLTTGCWCNPWQPDVHSLRQSSYCPALWECRTTSTGNYDNNELSLNVIILLYDILYAVGFGLHFKSKLRRTKLFCLCHSRLWNTTRIFLTSKEQLFTLIFLIPRYSVHTDWVQFSSIINIASFSGSNWPTVAKLGWFRL